MISANTTGTPFKVSFVYALTTLGLPSYPFTGVALISSSLASIRFATVIVAVAVSQFVGIATSQI